MILSDDHSPSTAVATSPIVHLLPPGLFNAPNRYQEGHIDLLETKHYNKPFTIRFTSFNAVFPFSCLDVSFRRIKNCSRPQYMIRLCQCQPICGQFFCEMPPLHNPTLLKAMPE